MNASEAGEWPLARLTPGGHIILQNVPAHGVPLSLNSSKRITHAFSQGSGHGILHLGASELSTELHSSLGFWRDLGQEFVARVCTHWEPNESSLTTIPKPNIEKLEAIAQGAPPMVGGELVSSFLLARLWTEMGEALTIEAGASPGGVQAYLSEHNSVWNVLGKVCFHLAENKNDTEYPFAFIATYGHQVSRDATAQQLPLHRALKEYSGEKNKERLLSLLAPLKRVADKSKTMAEWIDSGDIYQPLALTPQEAHQFLSEIPLYEQAGLVVRVPNWWNSRNRARPQVSVSVGTKAPSSLGMDALLDFDVRLTLGGKSLTKKEIETLLSSSEGLMFLKGSWVEVDPEKLVEVLEHFRKIEKEAQEGGLSFAEGLRLLAGAQLRHDVEGELTEEEREWSEVVGGKWLVKRLASLGDPKIAKEIENGAGLNATLRPYQKKGIAWLWSLYSLGLGGCLADDMGLGKTIQVLGLLSLLRRKKVAGVDLLVVPASLIDNWQGEMKRFLPRLKVLIAHASHLSTAKIKALPLSEVNAYDVVVTTYGTVGRVPWMKAHDWRCLILDEAQAIKNPAAQQTRAIKSVSAQWRLALTGTPVENKLGDLWSIFDFINPSLLGTTKQFSDFCKRLSQKKSGVYAPLRQLVQPYILRRLKTDKSVISDLPEKTEVSAHCLLSKKQAALYQESVDEMTRIVEEVEGIKRRGIILSFLLRFKQICNHPSQWLGDGEYDPEQSGKFTRLRELCESIVARQDKVLIFTQFRAMTDVLASFLSEVFGKPGLVLHGGTPIKNRQSLVKKFQEDEEVPFMILSLKAGGTGLNLTAASHVIHFDRWWNPAVEKQATDRAFRIGQKKNVLVHQFVCKGTIEERIDAMLASKQSLSDEILAGGVESSFTEMNNQELLKLVSLDVKSAVEL